MKYFLSVIFVFLFAGAYAEENSRATKLNFAFYITSQCRDTINFVTTKLNPTYQEFKDQLNIEFVPWGKSKRQPNGEITCQFGPTDCTANKLQSCALHLLGDNQAKQMEYIDCEMSTLSSVSLNYKCVTQVGISESAARQCYDSSLGNELQAIAEQKTGEITMIFVPTIVYNNKYDVAVQNAAFSNFRKYVCELLQKEDPNACK